MRRILIIGIFVFIAVAAACSHSNNPPLQTEASSSAIRAAEEVGAGEVPQAALHLQFAREELALANDLDEKGEKDQAASMLQRAEADAELAILLSREQAERSEAVLAMEQVHQLQKANR